MSFRVSVYLPHDEIPVPADASKLDAWLAEYQKFVLYSEPLGGDHAVCHFWSSIAIKLELPLIASIYDHGLHLESSVELKQLERELEQIEDYWNSHPLEDPDPKSAIRDDLAGHLRERIGYMREAIIVAQKNRAILIV